MLWVEKGGQKQAVEEIEAYNPLLPQGLPTRMQETTFRKRITLCIYV